MRKSDNTYVMNFIKKLLFILSLIAGQLLVKTGAQTGEKYSSTASTASSIVPEYDSLQEGYSTIASTVSFASSTVPGCGGNYTNLTDTISSPNYPSNYNNNLSCYYNIHVPTQKSVNITFISFDTVKNVDWLQINCYGDDNYNIPNQAFTGSTSPPFLSIHFCRIVSLWFSTDGSDTRQGFSLKYDIGNGMEGGLTMKPMNSYVRMDRPTTEPTILSCSSRANKTDAYPWWSYSRDGCYFSVITAPNCSVLPSIYDSNSTYFTTATQYSTRTCNLTISSLYINNAAGFYTCTDATLDYAFALVDTIASSFTVASSSQNEVVQGDQISLTCSVSLLHDNTSTCFQLTPSVYIYSGDNQRPILVSNTTATINVAASANVLPSYVCRVNFTFKLTNSYPPSNYATNLPENISSTKTFPPVLYWPESTNMVINGDDNGRVVASGNLTCYVPANPPATYQWTTKEYGFPSGPTVIVSHNGTYTCTATNVIRRNTYVASKAINITTTIIDSQKNEPEDKFNSVALAVGVVLGIAVLLLLVVAIVEFVLLRRKRNSDTMDVNYDYIDDATRTGAGPANGQGYELIERQRLDVDQEGAVATSGHRDVPPIPPMYDRITSQTYDTEIHTKDKTQPYDTIIHTEDKSQPYLQTCDTEIPVHIEDKSLPYLALYE